jgi:hypothetical protein
MQFLGLVVVVPVLALLPRVRKWLGIVLPLALTIAVYAECSRIAREGYRSYVHLLELYPYESMEERVRVPDASLRLAALPDAADTHLLEMECFTDDARSGAGEERIYRLRLLHEATVDSFLNSPGFGFRRRPIAPEAVFLGGVRDQRPIPQPVARSAPPDPSELLAPWPQLTKDENLLTLHRRGVADFSYPSGGGYVKDRQHVAAFRSHEFSQVPNAAGRWTVETVDLVSLLCHTEPVAYVSTNLPRMQDLKEAPTRALDTFESSGLTKLRGGEFLIVGHSEGRMRMLGSIRAVKQCVTCHGCERGDLLGAFSYTLRSTGPNVFRIPDLTPPGPDP